MQTIPAPAPARNTRAYHCTYLDLAGILTKPADRVLFLEEASGAVISLSPAEVLRDVVVNGAVGEAMAQWVADMTAGGYAKISCTRLQGVS